MSKSKKRSKSRPKRKQEPYNPYNVYINIKDYDIIEITTTQLLRLMHTAIGEHLDQLDSYSYTCSLTEAFNNYCTNPAIPYFIVKSVDDTERKKPSTEAYMLFKAPIDKKKIDNKKPILDIYNFTDINRINEGALVWSLYMDDNPVYNVINSEAMQTIMKLSNEMTTSQTAHVIREIFRGQTHITNEQNKERIERIEKIQKHQIALGKSMTATYCAIQYALKHPTLLIKEDIDKTTKPINTQENTSNELSSDDSISPSYTYASDRIRKVNIIKIDDRRLTHHIAHVKHTIRCESWQVRGHLRTYKNGKQVWIKPYSKGKKRNDTNSHVQKIYKIPNDTSDNKNGGDYNK